MDPERTIPVELPMLAARPERGDAAANRARILEAARRLLAAEGPTGVSMDAVAAAANVGKGTVFRRFGDRAGLMQALISDYMRDFQNAFLFGPPPLGPGGEPAARLETFLVELVKIQREHLPVALAADLSSGANRDRVYGAMLFHVQTLIRAIDETIDADIVAAMLMGAVAPPVLGGLPRARADDMAAISASVRALLRGLAPDGAGPAGRRRSP